MNKLFIILVATFVLFSCNQQEKKAPEESVNNPEASSISNTDTIPANENEFTIEFAKGASSVDLKGNMKSLTDQKVYFFNATKGQKLTGKLIPANQPANIRFNQIISPSGTADGPFGLDLKYDLNESGKWQLIIAESNMNGEPYIGDYNLSVSVE